MILLFDVRQSDTDLHDQNTVCLPKITKPAIIVIMPCGGNEVAAKKGKSYEWKMHIHASVMGSRSCTVFLDCRGLYI
jgi:hypothetical protein